MEASVSYRTLTAFLAVLVSVCGHTRSDRPTDERSVLEKVDGRVNLISGDFLREHMLSPRFRELLLADTTTTLSGAGSAVEFDNLLKVIYFFPGQDPDVNPPAPSMTSTSLIDAFKVAEKFEMTAVSARTLLST